jgi:hypothetical protein
MAEPIIIFRGSTGLNTKTDPARIPFDPNTGIQDLAVAVNADHDRTGRVSRRKGFAATSITAAVHSLWCDGGPCLFVTGTSLCKLGANYSYSTLATVTAGARVSYFQLDSRSYWQNGFEKGYIEFDTNNSWVRSTYVGPDTTRQFSDPPIGHLIAYDHGRVWIAQGPVVCYSEPYSLNDFDLASGFLPFESRISMLRPVKGGVFFSDQQRTYFAAGADPKVMDLVVVSESPVIEGTDKRLDMEKFGDGSMTGQGAIWAAKNGVCVGMPTGQVLNMTFKKLSYPSALKGAGLCFDNRYVATLEP